MNVFAGKHVHLMGIGGCGMSSLVPLLLRCGAQISGCDVADSRTVQVLRAAGHKVWLGHDPAHVAGVDVVVHTSAIAENHRELRQAQAAGCMIMSRASCLAELMREHRTLAVVGSHGKTSTAWMVAHLLRASGCDPAVMIGGDGDQVDEGQAGGDGWFVAEVDESDGGFGHVDPRIVVVTNLEAEHVRHYGDFSGLVQAMAAWLAQVPEDGLIIAGTERMPEELFASVRCPVLRCGIEAGDVQAYDLHLEAGGGSAQIRWQGRDRGRLLVPRPGRHMIANAVLAWCAANAVQDGVDPQSLATCTPIRRRFTDQGSVAGVRVIEDYAHHPTEVTATIAAAALAGGAVHVLFQPHRYTRTADCFADFCTAFDEAAAVVILPVYAAAEDPVAGPGARQLAEAIATRRGVDGVRVQHLRQIDAAVDFVAAHARPGDSCLVLGAGDVSRAIEPLRAALARRRP